MEATAEKHQHKISATGANSNKYGNCEKCGKHADSVYIFSEMRQYDFENNGQQFSGWTFNKCRPATFGHLECLNKMSRPGSELVKVF